MEARDVMPVICRGLVPLRGLSKVRVRDQAVLSERAEPEHRMDATKLGGLQVPLHRVLFRSLLSPSPEVHLGKAVHALGASKFRRLYVEILRLLVIAR